MNTTQLLRCVSLLALVAAHPALAEEAAPANDTPPILKALISGTPWIDARYRFETVHQDGLAHDANANTLRVNIGYKTAVFHDFQIGGEIGSVLQIGADLYNDSINGKTTYPTVADPYDTQLHQAYLTWTGLPQTTITGGRQLINIDNQRFIGASAWRQTAQTFDAIAIVNTSLPKTELSYNHVFHANRIFGTRSGAGTWDTVADFIHGSYQAFDWLKLTGYVYLMDIQQSPTSSSTTYGGRLDGKYELSDNWAALYTGEYARQTDYGNNPGSYGLNYYAIEPGISWTKLVGKVGYEVLEGNDTQAVQTPLATLHAFNGWADKFLTTPAAGLNDFYVSGSYTLTGIHKLADGVTVQATWHDFHADKTSLHYGNEWDAQIAQTFYDHYTVAVKYADYNADKLFTDTQKIMVQFQVKF